MMTAGQPMPNCHCITRDVEDAEHAEPFQKQACCSCTQRQPWQALLSAAHVKPTRVSGSALQNASQAPPLVLKFSPTLTAQMRPSFSTLIR